MAEMGLSDVIEALQVIIGKFGEQVAPHAHTLVGHLSQAFQRYAMAEGDDESAFAAMNCLDAISALLDALSTAEEEEDDEDDSTTEADYRAKGVAEAAAAAANPNAPPKPSKYVAVQGHRAALRPAAPVGAQRRQPAGHRVHRKRSDAAGVHDPARPVAVLAGHVAGVHVHVPLVRHVRVRLHRGRVHTFYELCRARHGHLLAGGDQALGLSYAQMYYNVVQKVLTYDSAGRRNKIVASQMLMSVLHWGRGDGWPNAGGRVDQFVAPYMQLVLGQLQKAKHISLKVAYLEVIESCIVYSPAAALALLEQAGAIQTVFTMWMQPGVLAKHEEIRSKRLCAGHAQFAEGAGADGPGEHSGGMPQIFAKSVEMLANLEAQRDEEDEADSFWEDTGATSGAARAGGRRLLGR